MQAIWITGANGFVGSHFCRHLREAGCPVVGLVRNAQRATELNDIKGLQISETDPGEAGQLRELAENSPPSVIVHCAASVGPEKEEAEKANIQSVENLLALAGDFPFHLIHISTISVYDLGKHLQINEDAPLYTEVMPENLYGTTKAIGDRLIQRAMKTSGLTATIIRPGAIMGLHPRSSWSTRVPARLREKGIAAMPIPLDSPMPWLMIEGFCHALDLCIAHPAAKGAIYNLFDEVRPWRDYLTAFSEVCGMPVEDPKDAPNLKYPVFFADRIRNDLGYVPKRSFSSSLQEAVNGMK